MLLVDKLHAEPANSCVVISKCPPGAAARRLTAVLSLDIAPCAGCGGPQNFDGFDHELSCCWQQPQEVQVLFTLCLTPRTMSAEYLNGSSLASVGYCIEA